MRITVSSTLGELESDLRIMTRQAPTEFKKVVRKVTVRGNGLAKGFAKQSAGSHGKLYHKAFTWEVGSYYGSGGGGNIVGIYGPDSAFPQGGMEFERGSRNSPPHLDLAKSADIIGPELHTGVQVALDRLFWPGAS